jgi:hypothetical protein
MERGRARVSTVRFPVRLEGALNIAHRRFEIPFEHTSRRQFAGIALGQPAQSRERSDHRFAIIQSCKRPRPRHQELIALDPLFERPI